MGVLLIGTAVGVVVGLGGGGGEGLSGTPMDKALGGRTTTGGLKSTSIARLSGKRASVAVCDGANDIGGLCWFKSCADLAVEVEFAAT